MPEPSNWMCSNSLKAGSFFNTCSTIPTFHEKVGGHGQPGWSAIITSNCIMYSSMGHGSFGTIDSVAVSTSSTPGLWTTLHPHVAYTLLTYWERTYLWTLLPIMLHCMFLLDQLSIVKTPRSVFQNLDGVGSKPQGTDYLNVKWC